MNVADEIFAHLDADERPAAVLALRREIRSRMSAAPSKHCPTCDRDLPAAAFARDSTRKDGLRGQCRECGQRARRAE